MVLPVKVVLLVVFIVVVESVLVVTVEAVLLVVFIVVVELVLVLTVEVALHIDWIYRTCSSMVRVVGSSLASTLKFTAHVRW